VASFLRGLRAKSGLKQQPKRVAIIGAGWAGCAAAVRACELGHQVSLIEAARRLGGRARTVELHAQQLDNGQHILLGAYSACLELMRSLDIDIRQTLLRLPLQMVYPHQTGMQFIAPKLPAPLHLLFALLRSQGLDNADKMALARFSTTARWMGWQLHQDCSVSALLDRYDQTERLCRLMWHPLCIAALNTPPERASAQVFLNVLRDSLGASRRSHSDMLIPRSDLSQIMPDAAADFVQRHRGQVLTGTPIKSIKKTAHNTWCLDDLRTLTEGKNEFDSVIIATSAKQCHGLLSSVSEGIANSPAESQAWSLPEFRFDYEPITTCYLQYASETKLSRVFFALADQPALAQWGQFVFDRGQLNERQAGLLAVVVSASSEATQLEQSVLARQIAQQLANQLQMPALLTPQWTQVITEKRATFACAPNLKRPENHTAIPGLLIAGDYTKGDYPATLEGAVRSGLLAASYL
jgi:squalene-associated FAD-dependent desaturase